jgi:aspartate racemase
MKVLGLIGGMSWESSAEYYRIINETVKARLGGWHSARCVMYSVDFADIAALQHAGRWDETAHLLVGAARRLERADVDAIVLCTNTMHRVAPDIEAGIDIPLIHIVDVTADRIKAAGIARAALLGTRFTMEDDFYVGRLAAAGIDVVVPDEAGRALVHDVIYEELCLGTISDASRAKCLAVVDRLVAAGAQGVVLGCTELPLLLKQADCATPLFDTTRIHAEAAVDFALAPAPGEVLSGAAPRSG